MKLEVDKTILKCPHCKNEIVLEDDEVLYYGTEKNKNFYHRDCLIDKMTSRKRGKLLPENIDSFVNEIIRETINMKNFVIDKERLERWIHEHYGIVVLPKYFIAKLEKIYDGFYEGITEPISPKDILDMWNRQVKYGNLAKIRANNIRRGIKLDGIDLINYELAVLLNKYDSYKKWKRKVAMNKARRESHEILTNYVSNKDVKTKKQIEEEENRLRINDWVTDFLENNED